MASFGASEGKAEELAWKSWAVTREAESVEGDFLGGTGGRLGRQSFCGWAHSSAPGARAESAISLTRTVISSSQSAYSRLAPNDAANGSTTLEGQRFAAGPGSASIRSMIPVVTRPS